jgi:hypothetical protein
VFYLIASTAKSCLATWIVSLVLWFVVVKASMTVSPVCNYSLHA